MVAVPGSRACTRPVIESTLAVSTSLDCQRNRVALGRPSHGLTIPLTRTVSPTRSVAVDGETVGLNTPQLGTAIGMLVASWPQPAIANKRPLTRTTFMATRPDCNCARTTTIAMQRPRRYQYHGLIANPMRNIQKLAVFVVVLSWTL